MSHDHHSHSGDHHSGQHHAGHQHAGHQHDHGGDDALSELLDLDAEVLAEALAGVRADIARLADSPVREILDLGAGTGTGTFGLLGHFPSARVRAVDASETMLAHLRRRADGLGLADRVTTVLADLDQSLPELAPVDLVWASASLHHLADPDRTLAQVTAAIRPGGLLAVVELAGPPRFVPDDAPGGAAEARAHALLAADRAVDLPTMGSDWGERLTRAGLVVELDRAVVADVAPPLPPVVGEYAHATLTRLRSGLADRLAAPDRDALDALLAGGANDVRRRDDLHVSSERRLWIARRPTRP